MAISGNKAIVGTGPNEYFGQDANSAYLYDVTTGQELFKLTAASAGTFGHSVAISGNKAIVGAGASAYLFDVTTGQELHKLTPSDAVPVASFGSSVAISGNKAIVGASGDDHAGSDSGSAYLFDATTGQELVKLIASDAAGGDGFGDSVAISGNNAIVGTNLGESAYLFDVTTGQELFKLTASDAGGDDYFGNAVAISGNLAIVGAYGSNDLAGAAYLFDATTGQELFKLTASDAAEEVYFGRSVAISGNIAIVGTILGEFAYMFDVTTGQELYKLTASDAAGGDGFGSSVAISGNRAFVGSIFDEDENGSAYYFELPLSGDPLPGDYNEDGVVDLADYTVWRFTLGNSVEQGTGADGNENGVVDNGDYDVWTGNYGATYGMISDQLSIPEPVSCMLFASGLLLLTVSRSVREIAGIYLPTMAFALTLLLSECGFAAPSLSLVPGGTHANGHLDSDGNWVWKLEITGSTSPVVWAVELGIAEFDSEILSAGVNATNFPNSNPGEIIWGWEPVEDVDPGAGFNMRPRGLAINLEANQIFVAFGSRFFGTGELGPHGLLNLRVLGPSTSGSLSTSLDLIGSGPGQTVKIAETTTGLSTTTYNIQFSGITTTAIPGDANLDGVVDSEDIAIFEANEGGAGPLHWFNADFNDDDEVDADDLDILLENLPSTPGDFDLDGDVDGRDFLIWQRNPSVGDLGDWQINYDGNAPIGASTAVPEPSAILLLAIGCLLPACRFSRG